MIITEWDFAGKANPAAELWEQKNKRRKGY